MEYDLSIIEGRVIKMDDLKRFLENPGYETRWIFINAPKLPKGKFSVEEWDILLFYNTQWLFSRIAKWYTHAILVLKNNAWLDIFDTRNSSIRPLQDLVDELRYDRVMIKRVSLSSSEKTRLNQYVERFLLNKPYPSISSILWWSHLKWDISKLYCSQWPWVVFNDIFNINLDSDWWWIVFPVDILNSSYGKTIAVY